jgi:hypothetical protein
MRNQYREDRQPLVLKPENRLAEVVLGLLAIFALALVLRD